jgi:hypothetical protein
MCPVHTKLQDPAAGSTYRAPGSLPPGEAAILLMPHIGIDPTSQLTLPPQPPALRPPARPPTPPPAPGLLGGANELSTSRAAGSGPTFPTGWASAGIPATPVTASKRYERISPDFPATVAALRSQDIHLGEGDLARRATHVAEILRDEITRVGSVGLPEAKAQRQALQAVVAKVLWQLATTQILPDAELVGAKKDPTLRKLKTHIHALPGLEHVEFPVWFPTK